MIFSQILSTNSLRKCMDLSLENVYVNNGAEGVKLFTHETCMNKRVCVLDGIKLRKCWCLREKPAKIPLEARDIADDKLALLHDVRFLKKHALARAFHHESLRSPYM